MPHPIRSEEQMARGPFEVSDFPDKIADTTVAFAMCKAVPEIVDGKEGKTKRDGFEYNNVLC
jgi:hypothetical protein